jgi:beta-galactosidase
MMITGEVLVHLSTTYYRSPFPRPHRWREDLANVAETGFDTIYLFVNWSSIEAVPGELDFSELDELVSIAGENGLKVIFNLASEMQPAWVLRLYPGTGMVDHMGRAVRSSTLAYDNFGIMPGGCSDHPLIRSKMENFFQGIARHFAGVPNVLVWDCWNEIRWSSQSDGYVCFCDHTVARFRKWLKQKFGTLDALNGATLRKYVDWEDVLPAKSQARNNTDMVLWQQFITDRAAEDLRWRYEHVRAGDPHRPIYAHAAFPTTFSTGEFLDNEYALGRGNDWQLARQVDGYGCSHFPAWIHPAPAEYAARLESVRSATGDKPYWIAELQGGAAGHGPQVMLPVPAGRQARWLWNGIARGAKGVNFWKWGDEGFGRESGGFGITGDDGHAEERLASLSRTARILRRNEELLDSYHPAPARIGVVFEPDNYHLDWSSWTKSDLAPPKEKPYPAGHSLLGYLFALERVQLPYDVIEAASALDLDRYKLLILPWPLIVDGPFAERLMRWIENGGTLLTEPSLDAFTRLALFQYPDERSLPKRLGFAPSGRRVIEDEALPFEIGGRSGKLNRGRWREELAPLDGAPAGGILQRALGRGRVIAVDSFVGVRYWEDRYPDFEAFVHGVATIADALAGIRFSLADGDTVQWRFGASGDTPVLFVINEGEEADLEVHFDDAPGYTSATDITTDECHPIEEGTLRLRLSNGGYHVLRFASGHSSPSDALPRDAMGTVER